MQKILIIGATSRIAEETARRFAKKGAQFYLLARDTVRLEAIASDLKIRGASSVAVAAFEAHDLAQHEVILQLGIAALGSIDIALIAYGSLPDQKACEQSSALTLESLNTNVLSVISLLTFLANYFEAQKKGSIAVITSVAGDRGRQSNYVYGTAKAALNIFLQGLRNRLYASGVHVLTIKPGFVDTPMTAAFKKNFLWVAPERIAQGVEMALQKKVDQVYVPKWWVLVMFWIRLIPEGWFKRLYI